EGRRAFGELLERAPGDPWTLAYVGDRLRAEGLFDEAVAAYDSLAHIMPDDPSVALRLALAYAGTGRLDVATRLLEHVAQSGGRGDDGRLGELASITQGVLLAGARSLPNTREVSAELLRRLTQTALPDVASLIVVRAAPSDTPLSIRVARERGGRDEEPADLDASALGLSAIRIERGDGTAHIRLRRPAEAGPSRPTKISVAVLVVAEDRAQTRLVTRDIDLAGDGKTLELNWNGEALL
ncbi:MAG TPA: tetratricopeptide repeat protein, partial [Polyangiaceae bacterium]|nr:tetratricopeptide repeat protein [Polyangiaceae bacterium]